MGYMHIDNLYKAQRILMFRECYALEKIHGTSAHVAWGGHWNLELFPGGEKYERFEALFDLQALLDAIRALGHPVGTVYGEAYGAGCQKQAWRYGDKFKFVAFDVRIGDVWLSVPNAHDVATKMGIEFVHYARIATDLAEIDAELDASSEQARRNGVAGNKPREGVVLRPLEEMVDSRGQRVMAKHKRDDERETATPRKVVDPIKLAVLQKAEEIAREWVTRTRMEHVLDKLGPDVGIERMRDVIAAMTEDVLREGAGEIVDSREARAAIGKMTADLFKARLQSSLYGTP